MYNTVISKGRKFCHRTQGRNWNGPLQKNDWKELVSEKRGEFLSKDRCEY